MTKQLLPALRMTLILTVLTGLLYPGIVTGLCQMLFPVQANGSLISKGGHVIGSALIGQNFTKPEYFHPRPSAAGNAGYDATASQGSNLGPTSKKLSERVEASVEEFHEQNPGFSGPIPADLITASASGLDPDLTPAAAHAQVLRVAKSRGVAPSFIERLVTRHTKRRDLGFLGEPRVNVLELNLALDERFPVR